VNASIAYKVSTSSQGDYEDTASQTSNSDNDMDDLMEWVFTDDPDMEEELS
jgi:hypothetical protein